MGAPVAACRVGTPESRVDTRAMPTHTGGPPEQACRTSARSLLAAKPTGRYGA
jgi:hypothetical protein